MWPQGDILNVVQQTHEPALEESEFLEPTRTSSSVDRHALG
jgi:hypothetical protein